MSQPFKLYRLQQIDSELDRGLSRIEEIDASLADNRREESSKAKVDQSKLDRDKANQALRSAEQNVQTQRLKIEQIETTLYSGKITNPKELQELQMEVESLRKFLSVLEDRQLEAMLEFDEKEAGFRTISNEHDSLVEQISGQKFQLENEKNDIIRKNQRLDSERQAAISNIPEQDMGIYETLRRRKNGVAVAAVLERTCAACGSTLTAASFSAVHNPNNITYCPTCGRILYLA